MSIQLFQIIEIYGDFFRYNGKAMHKTCPFLSRKFIGRTFIFRRIETPPQNQIREKTLTPSANRNDSALSRGYDTRAHGSSSENPNRNL